MDQSVDDAPTWKWQTNLLLWCYHTLIDSKILIFVCLTIFIVHSMMTLRATTPVYKVEAYLIENSEPASSMRAVSSGGLSSLLGGGATSMPEIDQFQVLMSSPEVATVLDNKYHLLHDIFRGAWDAKNNRWYPPTGEDKLHYEIVQDLGGIAHQDLNNYDLAKFLGSSIVFTRASFGSIMSMSMVSDRPEDAKRWLNIVIAEVSDVIRSQMIQQRESYVTYLQEQLAQATLTTSRDAIISILADQYRSLMVLKSAKTFPLQQIQPPTPGQFPTNKSVSMFMLYGILEGLLTAGILITCGIRDASFRRFFSRVASRLKR